MTTCETTPTNGVTLNLHLTARCNYRCRFCWATFHDVPGTLRRVDWLALLRAVGRERHLFGTHVVDKITFAGGEPTLVPYLPDLIRVAHGLGFTTCVVTNGSRIDQAWLERVHPHLDWVTLSVDSSDEQTNRQLGRGTGHHVAGILRAAVLIREQSAPRLRVNTVVTAANHGEDLSIILAQLRPERWKVLQATRIEGQNDGAEDLLEVSEAQVLAFCERHRAFRPVIETRESILGSYLMVDPLGRAFDDGTGSHQYGAPVLQVGLAVSVAQAGWSACKFAMRGGHWDWRPNVGTA